MKHSKHEVDATQHQQILAQYIACLELIKTNRPGKYRLDVRLNLKFNGDTLRTLQGSGQRAPSDLPDSVSNGMQALSFLESIEQYACATPVVDAEAISRAHGHKRGHKTVQTREDTRAAASSDAIELGIPADQVDAFRDQVFQSVYGVQGRFARCAASTTTYLPLAQAIERFVAAQF
ncbi:MAG: hypothetical protein P4L53_23810 [Candidatus Obscuribacterales bacterium]|nr:hypothetical protein [Candidatus Obscuribacterales bacterium]